MCAMDYIRRIEFLVCRQFATFVYHLVTASYEIAALPGPLGCT